MMVDLGIEIAAGAVQEVGVLAFDRPGVDARLIPSKIIDF